MSHVTVRGSTTVGKGNRIFQGAAIGCEPQDKKYAGEDTVLIVGDNNVIRENCTLSIGTVQDEGITRVGSGNLLMANVHVAHDCKVGDNTIIANNCALAGHVTVEDYAVIGGQTGLHQFTRVVGLRRAGFSAELLKLLKDCYHAIYREGNLVSDAVAEMQTIIDGAPEEYRAELTHLKDFVQNSPRGIIR